MTGLTRCYSEQASQSQAVVLPLAAQPAPAQPLAKLGPLGREDVEKLRKLSKFIPRMIYGANRIYIKSPFSPGGERSSTAVAHASSILACWIEFYSRQSRDRRIKWLQY